MAGTLTIGTLSDGTNSTSSTNAIMGSAKAWVKFGGGSGTTNGAIFSSFNVSSITVNTTGDFTANFTNAMPNSNIVMAGVADVSASRCYVNYLQSQNSSSSSFRFRVIDVGNGSGVNSNTVLASFFN